MARVPYYQINIGVNPGNSGGPLLDGKGRVIGMVTAKLRDKDGIAFAIPADDLETALRNDVFSPGYEATPEQAAWNRGCTVFERLMYLGDAYAVPLDRRIAASHLRPQPEECQRDHRHRDRGADGNSDLEDQVE